MLGEQAPIGLVVVILGVQERTVEIEDHRADRVSRLGADPGGELDDVSLRVADLRLAESVAGVARRLQLHQRKIEGRDAGKFGVHVVHRERQVTRRRCAAFEESRVAGTFEELERNAVALEEYRAQAG